MLTINTDRKSKTKSCMRYKNTSTDEHTGANEKSSTEVSRKLVLFYNAELWMMCEQLSVVLSHQSVIFVHDLNTFST